MTQTPSAADLIAQADAATTTEELDAIEAQAEGRTTVLQAVSDRRVQLAGLQDMTEAENSQAPTAPPIVDPSPHAPPIQLGSTEYVFPPAAASPPEVLELEPNSYESATEGPHAQISQTAYVEMTKPDGTTFLAPLANVEHYEAKGFSKGAEEEIPDLVAYWAEKAGSTSSSSS
jgi:hypothetical protein